MYTKKKRIAGFPLKAKGDETEDRGHGWELKIKNVKLMNPPKNRVRVKSESGSLSLCFPSLPYLVPILRDSHSLYVVGGKNKKGNDFSPPLVFHFELL